MKVAVCFDSDAPAARLTVGRMLDAQRLRATHAPHVVDTGSGALGWLTTFDRVTGVPLARAERQRGLMDGSLSARQADLLSAESAPRRSG